ncbi:MAG TPA: L-2-amino-thiazoline-4-carboxylic acid hydrolase [Steroidobacteraceae bacterium]|nr:L-2-amino-thiazoline-4-carboxylic acid hydrolase [Steroidobacteraceae bacterium]
MPEGPSFEQVRAQAAVLVPLVKLLRQEIGVERANDIVVRALAEWAQSIGRMLRELPAATPLAKLRMAIEGLDAAGMQQTEFLQSTDTQLDYNVRRCRAAEFYRSLGLEDLGYLLVCRLDESVMPALDAKIAFVRDQTLMQGAAYCTFRFTRPPEESAGSDPP